MTRYTAQLRLTSSVTGQLKPCHIARTTIRLAERSTLYLRPLYISVDPYMRTRMHAEGYGYIERWAAGSVLSGWTLAEVVSSQRDRFKPGDIVAGHLPMQDLVACDATDSLVVLPRAANALAYLHPLGMTGFTAWLGMQKLGQPQKSDTVLVSAAAGAVGSIAAQLAKRQGARVIVTAGRADKRSWLRQLGFETVLDHRHHDYAQQLESATPEGITLNFENVGGAAFSAAIEAMRPQGRVVLCGLVSQYQTDQPRQSPRNFTLLTRKGVAVYPFVVPDYLSEWAAFQQVMAPLVTSQQIHWRLDTVSGGLDSVASALVGVLNGDNLGKRVVAMT